MAMACLLEEEEEEKGAAKSLACVPSGNYSFMGDWEGEGGDR